MMREIWTYLETDGQGDLFPASKELLAQAKIIAPAAQEKEEEDAFRICAVLAGADHDNLAGAAAKALQSGADRVIVIEGDALAVYSAEYFSDAIGRLAETGKPAMILFERTTDGMDLAPRLAARLDAGMISDCVDIEKKDGRLLWVRHAFGGTAAVSVAFREENRPQIISIRPGSFGGAGRAAKVGEMARGAESTASESGADTGAITFVSYPSGGTVSGGTVSGGTASGEIASNDVASGGIAARKAGEKIVRPELAEVLAAASDRGADPASASVIVAGGNGAGPEGFKLIEELAELLHGAVGASRVAVDKGWISHSHLIGQSGITVTPDLYINCGISGSVQHIVGMRDAKCVISINKDPKALIFNVSDYGIVGDLHKILPALIAEIRRHRG